MDIFKNKYSTSGTDPKLIKKSFGFLKKVRIRPDQQQMLELQYRDMHSWARLKKQHYRLSFACQGKKIRFPLAKN
jgi:hypothetical protein